MYSVEESFMKKDCFEIVEEEVQTLVDQGFVIKVARMVFSPQSSVYSKNSKKATLVLIRPVKDTMVSTFIIS